MKDARDSSAEKEATPLFVGGRATKPKKQWGRPVGIAVLVLLVIAALVAGWWFFIRQDPDYLNISKLDSSDRYIVLAQQYAEQPVPNAPKDKAIYYGNIALALKNGKEYVYSERYYLLAQKIVDDNNVDKKEVEFYRGLSDLYKAIGNQKKADEYAKKEEDFLNANYSPEVLKQMREAKLNGVPR